MLCREALRCLHIPEGENAGRATIEIGLQGLFVRGNGRFVAFAWVDVAIAHDYGFGGVKRPATLVIRQFRDPHRLPSLPMF